MLPSSAQPPLRQAQEGQADVVDSARMHTAIPSTYQGYNTKPLQLLLKAVPRQVLTSKCMCMAELVFVGLLLVRHTYTSKVTP